MEISSLSLSKQTFLVEGEEAVSWILHSFAPTGDFHTQKNQGLLVVQEREVGEPSLDHRWVVLDIT